MIALGPKTDADEALRTGRVRWIVCALLFAAVTLSYVDRQVLSVLKPHLQEQYAWTETGYADIAFWFQAIYGVSYVIFGRIIDRFGARIGYAAAVGIWAVGHMAQAFVTTTTSFVLVRIPLAFGEAGTFPGALAAVAEWFPKKERALAIGIFNAGANVGAILTPLIVPVITLTLGWQAAFIITGLVTAAWVFVWLWFYRKPREHKMVSAAELAHIESDPPEKHKPVAWSVLLTKRQTWAYMLGRFTIDPIWWTFLFWLPDFFGRRYGVDLLGFGPPLVAIYILADVGSVLGGWRSSALLKRGVALPRARKMTMLLCALVVTPVAFAMYAPSIWVAVALIGLATAGHQGFSANLYALPGDVFPRWAVGSVVGLGGFSGALGGMLMAKFAGRVLETLGTYTPIFIVAASAYLVSLLIIHLLARNYEPAFEAEPDQV
ncbi:MAG: MFS transporter [Pseudomonadota bacterium]|nr:MFS transporter [Pseudomonadota bacterium]